MDEQWTRLWRYLPSSWETHLRQLPTALLEMTQELRLRVGRPPVLSAVQMCRSLPMTMSRGELQDCFLRFCGHAVHAHQDELAQGFVTTEDGFRVGVAGRAVVKEGRVVSYRDITSLCVRVSRPMIACASPLLPFIVRDGQLRGLLLCGAPSCGKTTVLRDMARLLSKEWQVAVVDERRELATGGLEACDVLSGCPKSVGILQAVRTLSPDVIVVDELGGDDEWRAAATGCFLGVPLVASVHVADEQDIMARPLLQQLLRDGGFDRVAFLPPRSRLCDATEIRKARDLVENRGDRADRVYLRGHRHHSGLAHPQHRSAVEGVGAVSATIAQQSALYGGTDR